MATMYTINTGAHACMHCGLPIPFPKGRRGEPLYCCHACRLVAGIIGKRSDTEHSWNLLRLGIGTLLAMNVMMISILLYTGAIEPATVQVFQKVLLALSLPALAILLSPFIIGAAKELSQNRMSFDFLIAGGSLAAFIVSTVHTWQGSGHVYFDTATMLPVLVTVGKVLESTAKKHAADLIRSLESILPATVVRLDGNEAREIPLDQLRVGDRMRIRPGERIAADGHVLEGRSYIEEAPFTGEGMPRMCGPGDRVIAGSVNNFGSLVVMADEVGENMLLHRIIRMTDMALRNRATSERLAEKAAMLFVPVVLIISVASGIYWLAAGYPGRGGLSALAVLVVACPCTMGIATPLATSLAIARAAGVGVVVRGGDVMEQVGKTEMVVFDKTGTLTDPIPELTQMLLIDPDVSEHELLGRVASLEAASGHPLARAICNEARRRGVIFGTASGVATESGGIRGIVNWQGSRKEIIAGAGVCHETEEKILSSGTESIVSVAWEGKQKGILKFSAGLRPDALSCMAALREQGIETLLLSGDRHSAAADVASRLGIGSVNAPFSPEEKYRFVTSASESGKKVVMVGDGINDAPALAAAPVGIAVGRLELARHSGNITIISGKLGYIPWLIRLSRCARRIVIQNFAWAFGYNGIAVAAAATGYLHPLLAAVAMVVSSLTVIGNSIRIRSFENADSTPPAG